MKTITQKTVSGNNTVKNSNGSGKAKPVKRNGSNGKVNRAELERKVSLIKERCENTARLTIEKAVAHFENPSVYPLPAGKNAERAFYEVLNVLPKKRRNKVIDKINETLKAGSTARKAKYKDIAGVDFKSKVSVLEQVKAMAVPAEMTISEDEIRELESQYKKIAVKPSKIPAKKMFDKTENRREVKHSVDVKNPEPQIAGGATKISLFVDNMTCLNPDDVLKDEINIAGFAIDSAGNNIELGEFFVGKFRKNETVNLGNNSRVFTLNIDPFLVQQSFSANLFIIESDFISNPELVRKLSVLFSLLGVTLLLAALGVFFIGLIAFQAFLPGLILGLLLGGGVSNLIGHYVIPLMGDDISLATTDVLTIEGLVQPGTVFDRTLQIGKGFDFNSTFDGKYTAAARWVAEA